jgi:predicted nucleotidyltransferase
MNKLALLFHSEVRAGVLRILFGVRPEKRYRAEIVKQMDFAKASVEEELQKLVDLELLTTTTDGNRRYYAANQAHPLYPELRNVVLKTSGLTDLLQEALQSKKIEFAFVFGSVAARNERADSDVDLMIIGPVTHRDLASPLRALTDRLGREINPHFFTIAELARRRAARDHFINDVLANPKLFIIGDEHEFTNLVGRRLAPAAPDQP